MQSIITKALTTILEGVGVTGDVEFSAPPRADMGDVAFACFGLAKEQKLAPPVVAKDLVEKIQSQKNDLIADVKAFGPYLNFYLHPAAVAELVIQEMNRAGEAYGRAPAQHKKIMVEFAHPNTHKAFHIGHLRNIVTGESIVRLLENAGHEVVRANYQGDVGLHIAKCLWGIEQLQDEYAAVKNKSVAEQAVFLGKAYALGAQTSEKDEVIKAAIGEINKQLYTHDPAFAEVYATTRAWSLAYLETIYKRVDTHFDRLYFESEVFEHGREIVLKFMETGVFKKSEGATIFEGSKYGLHDRVFLNSQGLPTYEAKELALGEKQFGEYHPDIIYHVTAKEQTGYFSVVFKALEFTLPESKDHERHVVYGWVGLKSGKMSSRTWQVVLGEWLLDEVEKKVAELMAAGESAPNSATARRVAIAAVKYAFLKTSTANDIAFDINESISLTGDSGPYLLYVCARIKSILRKESATNAAKLDVSRVAVAPEEKQLLLVLAEFGAVAAAAAERVDPSLVAHYLLRLAQQFNDFYQACPVLKAEGEVKEFRLALIRFVLTVAEKGLYLLGVKTVEEM